MLNFNITMLKSGIKMIFDWLCVEFYSTYLLSSYSVVSLLNMCQKTTCIWKGLYLQSLVERCTNLSKHSPVGKEGGETRKREKKKVKLNQIENMGRVNYKPG